MFESSTTANLQRILTGLGGLVLVIASLALAHEILVPLVIAILLAFILSPLVQALQRRGLRRTPAALIVVAFALLIIGGIGWFITAQVHELIAEMPQHQATIKEKIQSLQGEGETVIGRLIRMINEINSDIQHDNQTASDANAATPPMVVAQSSPTLVPTIMGIAMPLLEGLVTALLIVVLVAFMLVLREDLRNRLLRLMGHGQVTSTTKALDEATQRISKFLLMQALINAIFGAAFGLGLFAIGIPYAPLWGFLAAVMRFVPYLGIWVAILPPLVYSFAVIPGWLAPVLTIGLCLALEALTANVVEPIFLGHSTGISPIALLVAAAFWTWLWGPIGLLVSTPLTTCLVVLGKYVPSLEFLQVLLGDEPVLDTGTQLYQRLLARDQDEAVDLVEDHAQRHPIGQVCDEVLIPALLLMRINEERDLLTAGDRSFIVNFMRNIIDELPNLHKAEDSAPAVPAAETSETSVVLLGCPGRDEADELALRMLRIQLSSSRCRMNLMSEDALSAEVVAKVEMEKPDLVCIASLPPGGITQARYLCKRLRGRIADIKIAVGRWGQKDEVERTRERLSYVGADYVTFSLREMQQQIASLLPVLESQSPSAQAPKPEMSNGRVLATTA